MKIGLDIGSTTIKCVAIDRREQIVYQSYQRHYAKITDSAIRLLKQLQKEVPDMLDAELAISGSAGMGLAESCGISFVQEVYGTRVAAGKLLSSADVILELGGEDAKILFLSGGLEVRMNGSCAGGTGAFLDQMATLLEVSLEEMDELAGRAEKEYIIASRCGVFAKSDIQPLLNQGARKDDIAASIFAAVVSQTITGLAQGRPITGKVVYLGGPLTFLPHLRASFDKSLKTTGLCPEGSLYYVALGAAYSAKDKADPEEVIRRLEEFSKTEQYTYAEPLFADEAAYEAFCKRHNEAVAKYGSPGPDTAGAYFGVDAGSTTIKMVMMDDEERILCSSYQTNSGNPVPAVRQFLSDFYEKWPSIPILGSAVTGYGEDIVRTAFRMDYGVVETLAHYEAALRFLPEVDFIIDIGGQDIKCFKIKNKSIDHIFLNEACSSGCGSFLQTFANALGYDMEEFARLGLFGERPVALGSRCTVFMNSLVKQAQKDGASIENISAGLSISVVKNALYKVIRPSASEPLGEHIVVQGGTFLNDGVLRAFEQELKTFVVRPNIAGLMGACGAALYAKEKRAKDGLDRKGLVKGLLTAEELKALTHQTISANCGLCSNNCQLTINSFNDERRYIGGNRCSRPTTKRDDQQELNLYAYKRQLLEEYRLRGAGEEGAKKQYPRKAKARKEASVMPLLTEKVIGIPMGLNMYELLPFWQTFFNELGYRILVSPPSDRALYLKGQGSIASDTICYPAKLMHGHIRYLLEQKMDAIYYPCMTYNLDEGLGDNHYNCPVVAYYPEVIAGNEPGIKETTFIYDYIGLHRPKEFVYNIHRVIKEHMGKRIRLKHIRVACEKAYRELENYWRKVEEKGKMIIEGARREGKPIIVLCGRPYHIEGEINHGIDQLITGMGAAVISEDALSPMMEKKPGTVLNQWTYHSRLYAAAHYLGTQKDMYLVQLVSFGCGVDAITTDEVRDIVEEKKKIYTQIKIDEIANLGTVRIRLRSLLETIGGKG